MATRFDLPLAAAATGFALAFGGVLRDSPYERPTDVEAAGFFEPAAGPPLLIVALAVFMIVHRRHRLAAVLPHPAWWAGATILGLAAVALAIWSHATGTPALLVPALSAAIVAAGALIGGRPALKLLALPAAFLLLAFPLPAQWMNQILFPMQLAAADLAVLLLRALQVDAVSTMDLILVDGFDRVFHVIETCAGFRSIEILLMSAILLTELFPSAPRQRLLVVASAPFVGVALNAVRIVAIVLLPAEPSHLLQGVVGMVAGVLVLAAVMRGARALLPARLEHPPWERPMLPRARTLGMAGVLVVLAIVELGVARSLEPPDWTPVLRQFPSRLGDWRGKVGSLDGAFLGTAQPREYVDYTMIRGDEQVGLYVGVDDLLSLERSILSPKTLYMEPGVRVIREWTVDRATGGRARMALVRSIQDGSYHLFRRWYAGFDSMPHELIRALLALDRSPLRREGGAYVVQLDAPLGAGRPDEAALRRAEGLLGELERRVLQELERLWPGAPPAPSAWARRDTDGSSRRPYRASPAGSGGDLVG